MQLVIIDSIAAILRAEFGHDEVPARQEEITKQASHLKYIATKFKIPVIVTNQVKQSTRKTVHCNFIIGDIF